MQVSLGLESSIQGIVGWVIGEGFGGFVAESSLDQEVHVSPVFLNLEDRQLVVDPKVEEAAVDPGRLLAHAGYGLVQEAWGCLLPAQGFTHAPAAGMRCDTQGTALHDRDLIEQMVVLFPCSPDCIALVEQLVCASGLFIDPGAGDPKGLAIAGEVIAQETGGVFGIETDAEFCSRPKTEEVHPADESFGVLVRVAQHLGDEMDQCLAPGEYGLGRDLACDGLFHADGGPEDGAGIEDIGPAMVIEVANVFADFAGDGAAGELEPAPGRGALDGEGHSVSKGGSHNAAGVAQVGVSAELLIELHIGFVQECAIEPILVEAEGESDDGLLLDLRHGCSHGVEGAAEELCLAGLQGTLLDGAHGVEVLDHLEDQFFFPFRAFRAAQVGEDRIRQVVQVGPQGVRDGGVLLVRLHAGGIAVKQACFGCEDAGPQGLEVFACVCLFDVLGEVHAGGFGFDDQALGDTFSELPQSESDQGQQQD